MSTLSWPACSAVAAGLRGSDRRWRPARGSGPGDPPHPAVQVMPKRSTTGASAGSNSSRVAVDSTWRRMKKRPVSSLENWCDSVMLPAACTIAPLTACTMPGRSSQTSVRIQWVGGGGHRSSLVLGAWRGRAIRRTTSRPSRCGRRWAGSTTSRPCWASRTVRWAPAGACRTGMRGSRTPSAPRTWRRSARRSPAPACCSTWTTNRRDGARSHPARATGGCCTRARSRSSTTSTRWIAPCFVVRAVRTASTASWPGLLDGAVEHAKAHDAELVEGTRSIARVSGWM